MTSKLLDRIQVDAFRMVYTGLVESNKANCLEAFARATVVTSDERMGEALGDPDKLSALKRYLEMIKGSYLSTLYYRANPPKGRTKQRLVTLVLDANELIKELERSVL